MIRGALAEGITTSLAQRLETVAAVLGWDEDVAGTPEARAAELVVGLPEHLAGRPGPDLWLYLVAVFGRFPTATEVETGARTLELYGGSALAAHALTIVRESPASTRADLPLELVTDRVVISADYCAREDNHTGIQRVTRALASRWRLEHGAVAVADIDERTAFRNLAPMEEARVHEYGRDVVVDPADERAYRQKLVVPFRTTVVYPEVMHSDTYLTNLALARYSGNTTCAIGYDMIPILSSSLRPHGEAGLFTRYLSVVKHMTRLAAISDSAGNEFQGFVEMLAAQGMVGPQVQVVSLATEIDGHQMSSKASPEHRGPQVVISSRLEAHKNVITAVQAAHRLWQEGLDFELILMGGAGVGQEVVIDAVKRIEEEGHPIEWRGWVSDDVMWQTLSDAAFAVFISLHEGFGLPLVEAMSCGTPVLTSDFGSQAEIARDGGCLTVDPRSLTSVADGMRELITRPELRAELVEQIARRPVRRWDDYASDVWDFAVPSAVGGRP